MTVKKFRQFSTSLSYTHTPLVMSHEGACFSYYLLFKILNNDSYYHPGVVLANRRIRLEYI